MKWFKNIVSSIVIASLIWMVFTFFSIDSEGHGTLHSMLLTFFSLFLFITLLTYRIGLIERTKMKWMSSLLTIFIIVSLIAMQTDKTNVEILWKNTLVGYILLFSDSIFQITPKNKPLSLITKFTTIVMMLFFIVMITCQIESPTVYSISGWLVVFLSLLILVNYFMKARKV